jgi:hypothetical protein
MEASTGNLNPFLWIKKKCLLSGSNEVDDVNIGPIGFFYNQVIGPIGFFYNQVNDTGS